MEVQGSKKTNIPKIVRFECPKADWKRVMNAARRTWGKKPLDKEPSDKFKRKILLAEHSPIRLLEYDFTIEGIRQWVTVHLVRHHEGCEKFVHTQRQDINDEIERIVAKVVELMSEAGLLKEGWRERDYLFQGQGNDMDMTCNAQAFMNNSRKRLCYGCPSKETRQAWEIVIEMLKEIDPILAEKCVPECVYRSFCPEHDRCCGYVNTDAYKRRLVLYQNIDEEEWKEADGYKGFYVSSLGRVKREKYIDSLGRTHEEKYVAIINNKARGGYEYVHLGDKCKSLARLVAETFIPNPDNKPDVNHIDGNKYNNTIKNLEWVTSIENKSHAWNIGLINAKHRMQKIRCIETGEIFESVVDCSRKMGIDRRSIFRQLNGEKEKVKGYSFERIKTMSQN